MTVEFPSLTRLVYSFCGNSSATRESAAKSCYVPVALLLKKYAQY